MRCACSNGIIHTGADLALQAEVLQLLDVRLTVLDGSRTPPLRITGALCSEG
jgi:hypothetical protein